MSDTSRHPMQELVEEYALDLLDGEAKAAFEARMVVDAELAHSVVASREAITAAALSTPVALPPGLKARVMAQAVAAPAPTAPTTEAKVLPFAPAGRSHATLWLGAALAASLIAIVKLSSDLRQQQAATRDALAEVVRTATVVSRRDSMIARLTDPSLELVTLASTGDARPALKVYLDRKRRTALLSVASLETAPTGQAYQLWFIVDGKPVPSVTFNPGTDGRALVRDVALPEGNVVATAVTREPTGGSPAPTSPVLFVGSLKT